MQMPWRKEKVVDPFQAEADRQIKKWKEKVDSQHVPNDPWHVEPHPIDTDPRFGKYKKPYPDAPINPELDRLIQEIVERKNNEPPTQEDITAKEMKIAEQRENLKLLESELEDLNRRYKEEEERLERERIEALPVCPRCEQHKELVKNDYLCEECRYG